MASLSIRSTHWGSEAYGARGARALQRRARPRRDPLIRVATGDGNLKTNVVESKTDRNIMNIFPRDNGVVWVLSSRA